MRSKLILLSLVFSSLIVGLGMVNISPPKLPYKVSYADLNKDKQKQITCLAENMYFEAAHEPLEGKKAVAFVTINRVQTGNYANTICEVVQQKTGTVCQFSWYCMKTIADKRLTIRDTSLYNSIRQLATDIVVNYEFMVDVTNGSTYYHADYVNPRWNLKKIHQIGQHIFYKNHKDKIDKTKEFI